MERTSSIYEGSFFYHIDLKCIIIEKELTSRSDKIKLAVLKSVQKQETEGD